MSIKNLKNKSYLYAVMRRDVDREQDVVCAFTRTLDGAERLCDEYGQSYIDSGGGDEAYFYVVSNIFYDQ